MIPLKGKWQIVFLFFIINPLLPVAYPSINLCPFFLGHNETVAFLSCRWHSTEHRAAICVTACKLHLSMNTASDRYAIHSHS